ncbi:MAG: hypothetical protein ACWGQW_13175 [bacterium]
MLFQRVNRSDPEKVFVIGYNSSADSWSNGYCVRWDYSTDKDGVGMEKPAAAGVNGIGYMAIAGVAAETIASGAYGLVQVWGYHSAIRLRQNTTTKLLAGMAFCCAGALYCMEAVVVTGTKANCYGKGFALSSVVWTTAATAGFIMCL